MKRTLYCIRNIRDEEKLAELLNTSSRAPKQMELLLSYLHLIKNNNEVTQSELLKKSNATTSTVKRFAR